MLNSNLKILTTKQLPAITGLSVSFFEKGRIYNYGPPYYKIRGKVLYNFLDVDAWFDASFVDPEGENNDHV